MMANPMRGIDANLVPVLAALLTEQNVAAVAGLMHVSESSVSASLKKLRTLTGDQLLVRGQGGLVLTPTGARLRPVAQSAVWALQRALENGPQFDAATSSRTFWISGSEFVQGEIGAELVALLRRHAPHVRLRFDSLSADGFTPDMLFKRDVILTEEGSGVPGVRRMLFVDEPVVVVAATNRRLRDGSLSAEDLAQMRIVVGGIGISPIAAMFEGMSPPRVGVTVIGARAMPYVVRGDDLYAVVPRRRATQVAERLNLVIARTPLPKFGIVSAVHWHPSKRFDPAVTWLVSIIERAVTMADLVTPRSD